MMADEDGHRRLVDAMTALRDLLDISFEAFVQGLASPGVRENKYMFSGALACTWAESAAEHLLREQRWKDAIRYLESDVPELLSKMRSKCSLGEQFHSYLQAERVWYLAMAYWGDTGSLRSDLCQTALELFRAVLDKFERQAAVDLQRMSILYWIIGDSEKALALLDIALKAANETGLRPFKVREVSSWTFREASVYEFRQHCEEIRRMFRGEAIRPAFLGQSGDPDTNITTPTR
jgi:hypothetical protein